MKQGDKYLLILPDQTSQEFNITHVEETKVELTSIKTGEKLIMLKQAK